MQEIYGTKKKFAFVLQVQLDKPLEPLETFLKANFKLTLFDRKYVLKDERKIYDYKLQAIQETWCEAFNAILEKLFKFGKKYPEAD